LTLTAGAANWVGANPANLMPVSTDNLQVCNSVFASCVSGGPLTTTGTVVKTTTVATSGDVLGIVHAVAVPGSQAADTYSLSVTYLATANP